MAEFLIRSFDPAALKSSCCWRELDDAVDKAQSRSSECAARVRVRLSVADCGDIDTWSRAWNALIGEQPSKYFLAHRIDADEKELAVEFATSYPDQHYFLIEDLKTWPRIFRQIHSLTALEVSVFERPRRVAPR